MFYKKYVALCEQKNTRPYTVARELGLGSSNVAQWKKGSTPRPEVLQAIADYFQVSVASLLGHDEKQKNPAPEVGDGLTDLQREAVEFVKTLDDEQLRQFIRLSKAFFEA